MTITFTNSIAKPRRFNLNPLRWWLRLDAAYRQHHALKQATPEQLDDMGISFEQANIAFYRQFANTKHY